jgi:acetyl esterase/lipase
MAAAAPPPSDVTVTDTVINAIRVLQIDPPSWSGQAVYLHGGAYVIGSADTHLRMAAKYALASGARVWSIDYRLAPEHPYPAAVDDATNVWKGVSENMPTAIIGDSAGGGLALALARRVLSQGLSRPAAIALVSPWADLTLTNNSINTMATAEIMLSKRGLALDAERYCGGVPTCDPNVSPALADLHDMPPLLVQVGSDEILYDDAQMIVNRMEAAGRDVRLQIWQGMTHAWPAYGDLVPEAAASVKEVGLFCRKWLNHKE